MGPNTPAAQGMPLRPPQAPGPVQASSPGQVPSHEGLALPVPGQLPHRADKHRGPPCAGHGPPAEYPGLRRIAPPWGRVHRSAASSSMSQWGASLSASALMPQQASSGYTLSCKCMILTLLANLVKCKDFSRLACHSCVCPRPVYHIIGQVVSVLSNRDVSARANSPVLTRRILSALIARICSVQAAGLRQQVQAHLGEVLTSALQLSRFAQSSAQSSEEPGMHLRAASSNLGGVSAQVELDCGRQLIL